MSVYFSENWRDASRIVRVDYLAVPFAILPDEAAAMSGVIKEGDDGYSIELLSPEIDEKLRKIASRKLLFDRPRDRLAAGDCIFLRINGNFQRAVREVIWGPIDPVAQVITVLIERAPITRYSVEPFKGSKPYRPNLNMLVR